MKQIIKIYQKYFSILIHQIFPETNCRYTPTCSEYSYLAIQKFGIIKGTCLTFNRILKCNKLFPGGINNP